MAGVLLVLSMILLLLNWNTLSSDAIWMVTVCIWCLGLPVNAQWSVDSALQPQLKEDPNTTDSLMQRTHTLSSWFTGLVVTMVIALLILSVTAHSIPFNLFSVCAVSLLVPALIWNKLMATLKGLPQYQSIKHLSVFYDADCGFCLKMCLILRELLLSRETNIQTAQSNTDIFPIMDSNNSWVIQSANGDTYIHWFAMQHLFLQRWPFKPIGWLMGIAPLMRLGNSIYAWVATNRSTMSTITTWALPWAAIKAKPAKLTEVCLALAAVGISLLQLKLALQ